MLGGLFMAGTGLAADPGADPLTVRPEAVERWKDMRFGMFICWGPVSLTGREIGFKRDIAKELAGACREAGIGFFPYYSTCDWHHPDFPVTSPGGKVERPASNLDRYTDYLEAQVKELITGCGPLVGIWFDVPQRFDRARGERVIRFARSLQPDLLVNNRTGAPGDFDTPEQQVGRFQNTRPWESCITLGTQWTWKPDDKLESHTEAVRMLVVCAVGDGNLALNTNPMPDGRIEPRQDESFREIGAWLQRYGESVYGTRGGPFVAPEWKQRTFNTDRERFNLPGGDWWGGSTHKGDAIYLHILR
jgi:alpha-L-fucosidase